MIKLKLPGNLDVIIAPPPPGFRAFRVEDPPHTPNKHTNIIAEGIHIIAEGIRGAYSSLPLTKGSTGGGKSAA